MTTFSRYTLFQIPDWVIVAAVLLALMRLYELSLWMAAGLFILWVIKDFAVYPFLRKSYETSARTGSERLIGEVGTTKEWLQPEGYVEIHGQLWRAVADSKNQRFHRQRPFGSKASKVSPLQSPAKVGTATK